MNINFSTSKLQKIINAEKEIHRAYGPQNGRTIMRRMSVLAAASCLAEIPRLPPERCHELTGSRKGQFAVDLKHPFRLIFEPNHDPLPLKADGGIDLAKVTSITIKGIEDYH